MINICLPLDQYAKLDIPFEGTADEAIVEYKRLKSQFQGNGEVITGLPDKEWREAVDEYMNTNELKGGIELYNQMNERQQFFFQEAKKSFKRIKSKLE